MSCPVLGFGMQKPAFESAVTTVYPNGVVMARIGHGLNLGDPLGELNYSGLLTVAVKLCYKDQM